VIGKLSHIIGYFFNNNDGAKIDTLYSVVDIYKFLLLKEPNYETIVPKLTNLRDFCLDRLNIAIER
jgi:hypothetical protein